jgi:hypothetical protein
LGYSQFIFFSFFSLKKTINKKYYSKFGWGGLKIQKLKFDSILLTNDCPVDKENSI